MEAYCVKCKAKVEVKDAKEVTMKNGRPAISGVCASCGTKVFKIKSKEDK
jgi:RNase P subunit RPR2